MSRHIESLITMINQIADNAPKQENPEDTAQAVGGDTNDTTTRQILANIETDCHGEQTTYFALGTL